MPEFARNSGEADGFESGEASFWVWIMAEPVGAGLVIYVNFVSITVMTAHQLIDFAWPLTNTKTETRFFLALADVNQLQVYIVHVKQPADIQILSSQDLKSYYESFLPINILNSRSQARIIYSYNDVFSGFAARLTSEEVEAMKKLDGFLNAYPDRMYKLQTTHSRKFLGLNRNKGFWKKSHFGKGMIIGVLDTGIWPEHPSFFDSGVPPPPRKWKGICENMGSAFNSSNCNNKLIGARYLTNGSMFATDEDSIRDVQGHGTHTASTAAGAFVRYANMFGNANGTAAGVAALAHLAIYRVCTVIGCAGSDILAGMEAAVKDGVDVLSLSLGGVSGPFYEDAVAIGAFGAIEKGVFVSCAAGNEGPEPFTVTNEAPWILTVGASTLDRSISALVKLGNGYSFTGQSLYQPKNPKSILLPMVYPRDKGAYCEEGTLHWIDVKGKIVLCLRGGGNSRVEKGQVVLKAGGVGMILMNEEQDGFNTLAEAHLISSSHISYVDGIKIKAYINSTNQPMARIDFIGTVIKSHSLAPMIASFSSRGPNAQSPGILKPDIVGPGVSVLAAWPLNLGPNYLDNSKITFNVESGTSMATPHLSGIAALLKSSHPDWSPAMIKSAIMTTADVLNGEGTPIVDHLHKPANLFAMGSGHVNPSKANDPGLVYDIKTNDYIRYLCGLRYTDEQVGSIAKGKPVKCSKNNSILEGELNYPSFSVVFQIPGRSSHTFSRTVTNVGSSHASYSVEVNVPKGTHVRVKPSKLLFPQVNDKMSFAVTVTRQGRYSSSTFSQGYVKWVSLDKQHVVRSPISVAFV